MTVNDLNYSNIKTDFILNKLKEGLSIALVSDAGLPAISDPGEYLVKKVLDNSFEVICAPGPCAALTGLVSSGLPSENFLFMGFLPKKNIKLAVHRNYLKRTIRNLSKDIFVNSKISLIVVSKKRIIDFKKDKLRREIKTLFLNLTKKLNEENNYIFN